MKVELSQKFNDVMTKHALKEFPNECCGLVFANNNRVTGVIETRSINPSPDSYFMDPEQQIRIFSKIEKTGEKLSGIYHSHPTGPSYPSGMDLQLAFHPELIYFIITCENRDTPHINAYFIKKGTYQKINIVDI